MCTLWFRLRGREKMDFVLLVCRLCQYWALGRKSDTRRKKKWLENKRETRKNGRILTLNFLCWVEWSIYVAIKRKTNHWKKPGFAVVAAGLPVYQMLLPWKWVENIAGIFRIQCWQNYGVLNSKQKLTLAVSVFNWQVIQFCVQLNKFEFGLNKRITSDCAGRLAGLVALLRKRGHKKLIRFSMPWSQWSKPTKVAPFCFLWVYCDDAEIE